MKNITIIILLGFLLTLTIGCGNVHSQKIANEAAYDFKLNDINGNPVKLSNYSGKVIILNFFAIWCPPCRSEMPDFNEIASEYKDEAKVIAVSVGNENVSTVEEFAKKLNLTFAIVMDDGNVSRQYGPIRAIPVTVVIDRNFKIARKYIGARSKDVFVKDIEALGRK